jgi:hypothetical protein
MVRTVRRTGRGMGIFENFQVNPHKANTATVTFCNFGLTVNNICGAVATRIVKVPRL